MDGPFWVDTRAPHQSADFASVSLNTGAQALIPSYGLQVLGANYFSYVGKACRLRLFGRFTSVATPGNLTASLYWGTNAAANGTLLASATGALTASQTSMSWQWEMIIRCRALGSSGSLLVTGNLISNVALIANTVQPLMMPATAPAGTTVDLSANNFLSPQMLTSGTTGSAVVVHDYNYESLN